VPDEDAAADNQDAGDEEQGREDTPDDTASEQPKGKQLPDAHGAHGNGHLARIGLSASLRNGTYLAVRRRRCEDLGQPREAALSRMQIIVLSAVCCVFGGLALKGPEAFRAPAYAVNIVLAITAFFFAGRDLTERGHRRGYPFAGTYLLPLVGTFVYIALSSRPKATELHA
jgi:hypothetical protein